MITLTPEEVETLKTKFYESLTSLQKEWDANCNQRICFISKRYARKLGATYYIVLKGLIKVLEGQSVNYFCLTNSHGQCMRNLLAKFVEKHTGHKLPTSKTQLSINGKHLWFLKAKNIRTLAGLDGDVYVDDSNFFENLNAIVALSMNSICIKRNEKIILVI